jgi:hypothetical protein
MRLLDIERQKKWCEQVEVTVRSVGVPYQSQDTGSWEQVIEITDSMGRDEVLHYYWEDLACTDGNPMGSIPISETGKQVYRIKWTGNYFRCQPAKAPPKESLNAVANKPTDWDAKDRRIAKMSCARTSAVYYRERLGSQSEVLDFSKKLYNWIYE